MPWTKDFSVQLESICELVSDSVSPNIISEGQSWIDYFPQVSCKDI